MPRTAAGTRSVARGRTPYSLSCNGTTGYVDFGDVFDKDLTDTFAFAFSFYVNSYHDYQGVIVKQDGLSAAVNGYAIELVSDGSGNMVLSFVLCSDVVTDDLLSVIALDNPILPGRWYRALVSYDGSATAGGVTIAIDGLEAPLTTFTDNLTGSTLSTAALRFGAYSYSPNLGNLDGYITDVVLFDTSIGGPSIINEYVNQYGYKAIAIDRTLYNKVQAKWGWDEGAGTSLAPLVGGVTGTIATPVWSTTTPGRIPVSVDLGFNRTAVSQFRIPATLIDMGITNLISWRGGFENSDPTTVQDDIGNVPLVYSGSSGIANVYTTGEYSANLERGNSDYFASDRSYLDVNTNFTALSGMVFFNAESLGANCDLASVFKVLGNQLSWDFLVLSNNRLALELSNNGSSVACDYRATSSTLTDTGVWHSYAFTFNGTTIKFFKDGALIASAVTAGAIPASCWHSTAPLAIGAAFDAAGAPAQLADGKFGLVALALGTALSETSVGQLHSILNSMGRYI